MALGGEIHRVCGEHYGHVHHNEEKNVVQVPMGLLLDEDGGKDYQKENTVHEVERIRPAGTLGEKAVYRHGQPTLWREAHHLLHEQAERGASCRAMADGVSWCRH